MKKRLLYLFGGIMTLIICVVLYICWVSYQYCNKVWERPANVPAAALWKGGCDGGSWIELVEVRGDTLRFRIYFDRAGDLQLDADFVCQDCTNLHLTEENWSEYISDFGGEDMSIRDELQSRFKSDSGYCYLAPVYPAYYAIWENYFKSTLQDSTGFE